MRTSKSQFPPAACAPMRPMALNAGQRTCDESVSRTACAVARWKACHTGPADGHISLQASAMDLPSRPARCQSITTRLANDTIACFAYAGRAFSRAYHASTLGSGACSTPSS